MEKFNVTTKELPTKLFKMLALFVGMTISEQALAQTSIEQLITDAKKYELSLSEEAAHQTKGFNRLNGKPYARLEKDSAIIEVIYNEEARITPKYFLIYKDGKYYEDVNADGKIDAVLWDRNSKGKMPTEEEYMSNQLTLASASQVELDMSDLTHKKYMLFDMLKHEVHDTDDKTISKIKEEDRPDIEKKLQMMFKGNLESVDHDSIKK